MKGRKWQLGLLAVMAIFLAGCSAADARDRAVPGMPMPSHTMSPGMTMSGTPVATAAPSSRGRPQATGPSVSSQMICGPEIRADVAQTLALRTPASATATWADRRYTCVYKLAEGTLELSVKESPDVASAQLYFNGLRQRLRPTHPLLGLAALGLPSFDTPDGTVVFLKDDKTLQVDVSRLPDRVGPQHRSRSDLAYTIASDILGCWTGK